jgi:tryptophan synthase alpha chain
MATALESMFAKVRAENRAALIAYLPAGFPSPVGSRKALEVLAKAGIDAVEIGFPYSDPVMDGPTIQKATDISLKAGTGAKEVFATLKYVHDLGLACVVMTYWNPIERYGVTRFASDLALNGGSGVITPDLTIEESDGWRKATDAAGVNTIYVVAPSTSPARLKKVVDRCSGFVYAASLMGVTGSRTSISAHAQDLVARIRAVSALPIAVGLGVSTRRQAQEIARYADGVIVGSAFIKILLEAKDEESGLVELGKLAEEMVAGVREGR